MTIIKYRKFKDKIEQIFTLKRGNTQKVFFFFKFVKPNIILLPNQSKEIINKYKEQSKINIMIVLSCIIFKRLFGSCGRPLQYKGQSTLVMILSADF